MINYIEESYYPTVEELLKLPIFSTSYVAAGKGGLDRIVSGINLSDNPDYAQWISPGELMISTCFSVYKDPAALRISQTWYAIRWLHSVSNLPSI